MAERNSLFRKAREVLQRDGLSDNQAATLVKQQLSNRKSHGGGGSGGSGSNGGSDGGGSRGGSAGGQGGKTPPVVLIDDLCEGNQIPIQNPCVFTREGY